VLVTHVRGAGQMLVYCCDQRAVTRQVKYCLGLPNTQEQDELTVVLHPFESKIPKMNTYLFCPF
jgi:hypothetical protein